MKSSEVPCDEIKKTEKKNCLNKLAVFHFNRSGQTDCNRCRQFFGTFDYQSLADAGNPVASLREYAPLRDFVSLFSEGGGGGGLRNQRF